MTLNTENVRRNVGYTPGMADQASAIETPQEVVERIGKVPIGERTRAESASFNRASLAVSRARTHTRDTSIVPDDSTSKRAAPPADAPCPFEPTSPEGVRWLLARTLGQVSAIVSDPAATNRDILDAASMLRMAAGLGKEPAAPTVHALDMASMLGNAPDVTCPACAHRFDPSEGSAGNVGPSATDEAGSTGKADVSQ